MFLWGAPSHRANNQPTKQLTPRTRGLLVPASGPCPQPDQLFAHPPTRFFEMNFLFSHLYLGLLSVPFPSRLPKQNFVCIFPPFVLLGPPISCSLVWSVSVPRRPCCALPARLPAASRPVWRVARYVGRHSRCNGHVDVGLVVTWQGFGVTLLLSASAGTVRRFYRRCPLCVISVYVRTQERPT
jgi:hypothetical protein